MLEVRGREMDPVGRWGLKGICINLGAAPSLHSFAQEQMCLLFRGQFCKSLLEFLDRNV